MWLRVKLDGYLGYTGAQLLTYCWLAALLSFVHGLSSSCLDGSSGGSEGRRGWLHSFDACGDFRGLGPSSNGTD